MKHFAETLAGLTASVLWLVTWVAGIVLAKGAWSTFFAIMTGGLWSLYLVVERWLQVIGWIV